VRARPPDVVRDSARFRDRREAFARLGSKPGGGRKEPPLPTPGVGKRLTGLPPVLSDWQLTVRDGAFQNAEGVPTAGPQPYDVYRVTPRVVFGFGTDEAFSPTRWRF
jgi:hypothetical protein